MYCEEVQVSCSICASSSADSYGMRYDDRYGYAGLFDLMKCKGCGHIFLKQDFTPEQLTDLYSNYYPRSQFNIESYQAHQEKEGFVAWLDGLKSSAFRWVPKNIRVLDIGCGFGESLGFHAGRGCDVYGVEADENIRRVAEKFGYNVHVGLFDSDIYDLDFFDCVTMDQVMEHVTDPVDTLQGIARVLKPGGQVILTFPNAGGWGAKVFGRKWINWHTPYHLQFYSKTSMQKLAKLAGLEIVSVKTITASAWLYFQWLHLLTYPKINQPSDFWAISACGKKTNFGFGLKLIMRFLSLMHRAKMNHLITRFFDVIGVGDSYVVVMTKR